MTDQTDVPECDKTCANCMKYHFRRRDRTTYNQKRDYTEIACKDKFFDFIDFGDQENLGQECHGRGVKGKRGPKRYILIPTPCSGENFDPNVAKLAESRKLIPFEEFL